MPTPDTSKESLPSLWSRAVQGDGKDQSEALRQLAASYWYCVYAWWRRTGLDEASTTAATLATFTRWITETPPCTDDSGVARIREWIPARLSELGPQGVKLTGAPVISIDPVWAERRYADEPAGEPDEIFQRRWALTVLEFTAATLLAEYSARGEQGLYAELLAFAGFDSNDEEHFAAVAGRLGRSTSAFRMAVLDFRSRQREVLYGFVAGTVLDPTDANSEITALVCACDAPGPDASAAPLPSAIRGLRPDEILARAMQSVRMTGTCSTGWQPPTLEEVKRLFPQYEVVALHARGGMGAVYKARQVELDRPVAIKLLPLEVSADSDFADRFRREARALAKLQHPNIIMVHDFGTTTEGHLFFVMEFVDGADLHQMIHGPGLEPAQALEIISGICDALAYAHAKGVVHRDIKPANVMVALDGQVKVADFGLARLLDPGAAHPGHTMTGTVMGTPDYMAPEQMRGMNVDHRADIYSLGVMLYEMLCKEVPRGIFDPPSTRILGVSTRIDQVVNKAMQQQPDRRYQTTAEMKTDVALAREPAATAPKKQARPPSPKLNPRKEKPPMPEAVPKKPRQARAAGSQSKQLIYGGIAAAVAALVGVFFMVGKGKPKESGKMIDLAPAKPLSDPESVANPMRWKNSVNLLPLIDPRKDAVAGVWKFEQGRLLSDGQANARLQIPFVPPDEYDYRIVFKFDQTSRPNGAGQVIQVLTKGGRSFSWTMGGGRDANFSGIENIGGANAASSANPTSRTRKPVIGKSVTHTSIVQVRNGGTKAYLNGEVLADLKTDYSNVDSSPEWKLPDPHLLGLGSISTHVIIEKLDLIEVRGKGRPLVRTAVASNAARPPAPSAAPAPVQPASMPASTLKTPTVAATPAVAKQTIDLLALTDPAKDRITVPNVIKENRWERRADLLSFTAVGDSPGKIATPVAIRARKFEIETAFQHSPAKGRFAIDLPLHGRGVVPVWIQFDTGNVSIYNTLIKTLPALKGTRSDMIRARFEQTGDENAKILVFHNDVLVATWEGNLKDVLVNKPEQDHPNYPREPVPSLWCRHDSFEFTNWELRVFEGEAKVLREPVSSSPAPATKDAPFVNTLGMKFVPVPITGGPTGGKNVLFSIWETRRSDYQRYLEATKRIWTKHDWQIDGFEETPDHPAVTVSWNDATEFCAWLTKKERDSGNIARDAVYRLPKDHEWSCAVGIGDKEDPAASPTEKSGKVKGYLWGADWPPPQGVENYHGEEETNVPYGNAAPIAGFRDPFPRTAPVGSFKPNALGLYDLGGNVLEWCEEESDKPGKALVNCILRGESWFRKYDTKTFGLSSTRTVHPKTARFGFDGFRVVLETSNPNPSADH